ncbi:MAG: Flp family type IVb pilin [Candidatus Acidiferrales bacterium]
MRNFLVRMWRDEEGQDLTEYALLIVLVALFAIGAMKGLATAISSAFGNAAAGLSTAASN